MWQLPDFVSCTKLTPCLQCFKFAGRCMLVEALLCSIPLEGQSGLPDVRHEARPLTPR